MDQLVLSTIEADEKHRVIGQDEVDLFKLDDIHPEEWDYSLPTLTNSYHNEFNRIKNLDEFDRNLGKKFPFHIDMNHLLLAGGCPSTIYRNQTQCGDFDFFIYGIESQKEATTRVEQLLEELNSSYRNHLIQEHGKTISRNMPKDRDDEKFEPKYDVRCVRNKNAITAIFDGRITIQIILRLYKSKSEILHGFDVGSSAVGWDGANLYFTSLSKFAHEYSCNIIDTTRRSTTYERRLSKYFDRGFDIIFPRLDITKLRTTNLRHGISEVVNLPLFAFSYSKLVDNKITLDRFLFERDHITSDYQIEDLDEHHVFYINLHNLSHETEDYYFTEQGLPINNILNARPTMSRRRVINYYDNMKEKLSDGKSLHLRQLLAYVKNRKRLAELISDEKVDINTSLSDLLEQEKQRILKLMQKITLPTAKFPIVWRIENPGTQLTGSFNPIIENPEEWYKEYLQVGPSRSP
jgi:hypothetical protein